VPAGVAAGDDLRQRARRLAEVVEAKARLEESRTLAAELE